MLIIKPDSDDGEGDFVELIRESFSCKLRTVWA